MWSGRGCVHTGYRIHKLPKNSSRSSAACGSLRFFVTRHTGTVQWQPLGSPQQMLLRDHRPPAGQWAFKAATHRPFATASVGPGAAGHITARRGSLLFRQAADQPQPVTQDKPSPLKVSEQQKSPKQPLIQRQRHSAGQYLPFKKSARSQRQSEASCPACGGRGFQIVEEVCRC